MTLAELQGLIAKVSTIVGDAPVILKGIEGAVDTEIKSIGIELGIDGSPTSTTVQVNHGPIEPVIQVPTSTTNTIPAS